MASILSVLFLIVEAPHTIATIKKYKEREALLNADGTMEYIALAKGAYYFGRNISSLRESNNSNQALEKASYSKDYLLKNTGSVENVVLVFGESLNRNFMGVYGYQAPTTPYLNALKEKGSLLVFDNVISPAFYTDKSFTMLLTYANRDNLNQKAWYQYKNLAHILKLSDYKSVWITSQGYGLMWGNSYYQVAKHFDTYIENDKPYDENLAALFKRYYDNERESKKRKNFVVFHLIGNHFEYKNRFPKEFSRFNLNNTSYNSLKVKNNADKQVVTDYINSVYYNDYVLHSLIELFKDKDSLVIYLSDHGDDMFESSAFNTHECSNASMEIPFLIYMSDSFKQKHPQMVKSFEEALHKPFMSDDLLHTVLPLAGIITKDYEKTRDLFNESYNDKRARKPCDNKVYPMNK
ncbi:phosphoethanolamine transferase [Helicobacter pylori]|uniref:phosphoethanolamine transferase n=1 Tax=Helicobacter pylori TaxID=210 RepID=UPI00311CA4B7